MSSGPYAPHLVGDLHDHAELRPLLLLGQHVALLARGKAALRRQAKLIERHEFRRLVDAALDLVLGFQRAGLRGDEAEHHLLALRHEAQRLEAAGAVAVVLHEIAVHVDGVEQHLGHRLVAARGDEGRAEIAAAQMHGDGHVGGNVRHRRVDHPRIGGRQLVRILAAVAHLLDQLRIAEIGQVDLVELQIAAAGVGEGAHHLAVGLAEIAVELLHVGIDRSRHGVAAVAEMHRRRRRDRHLRRLPGVRLQELEVLDHRMAVEVAELAAPRGRAPAAAARRPGTRPCACPDRSRCPAAPR